MILPVLERVFASPAHYRKRRDSRRLLGTCRLVAGFRRPIGKRNLPSELPVWVAGGEQAASVWVCKTRLEEVQ